MSRGSSQDDWDIFTADHNLGVSPFRSLVEVWRQLRDHGWQTWMIFKSDFAAGFRQTKLGLIWGLIMPLVPLLAFFILTALRVFPEHEAIHPLSYMGVGVTLWLFLQGLVMTPTVAVEKHASVLKSSGFPLICLFLASYGRHTFEMLVRLAVVIPLLAVFYDFSGYGLAITPVLLFPLVAFGMAFGIALGLGGILLKDMKNLVDIVLRYLVFISFAIFPISVSDSGWWLYTLNPFAIFIDNVRNVLVLGELSNPLHFLIVSIVSTVLLILVLHLYYVLERRVAGAL